MGARIWTVLMLVAALAAVSGAAGRAADPFCDVPRRLLDPLGQDPVWTGRTDALLLWRDAPQSQPLFNVVEGDGGVGAVYGTAIALTILQLPWAYVPIYQR